MGQVRIFPRSARATNERAVLLRCPSDKSLTHRAVMFASMAKGSNFVHAPLLGEDCIATMQAFRALGVMVDIVQSNNPQDSGFLKITSPGWSAWKSPAKELDFANSGTTARLLTGLFAATPGLEIDCKGDSSLSTRPMLRVVTPLRKMGAKISGQANGNYLPLHISGCKLNPGEHVIDKASAQVKSALILAALNCEGRTKISLPAGSRNHTEVLLQRFNAKITADIIGPTEHIVVEGPFTPPAFTMTIPADPSSAAFFAVLAAIHSDLEVTLSDVLSNKTRNGFLVKLREAGVVTDHVEKNDDAFAETVFDLNIKKQVKPLKAFAISEEEVPGLIDEIPVLAVLASFCEGRSVFHGLQELRVKESDRLSATLALLKAGGIDCQAGEDSLTINGGGMNAPVNEFSFDPNGDHRLAMAAAILASRASQPCTVLDADCVKVSFPGFYDFLEQCSIAVE